MLRRTSIYMIRNSVKHKLIFTETVKFQAK
jgi:hypothetical protein